MVNHFGVTGSIVDVDCGDMLLLLYIGDCDCGSSINYFAKVKETDES